MDSRHVRQERVVHVPAVEIVRDLIAGVGQLRDPPVGVVRIGSLLEEIAGVLREQAARHRGGGKVCDPARIVEHEALVGEILTCRVRLKGGYLGLHDLANPAGAFCHPALDDRAVHVRGTLHCRERGCLDVPRPGRVVRRVPHARDTLRAVRVSLGDLRQLEVGRVPVGVRAHGRERAAPGLVLGDRRVFVHVLPSRDHFERVIDPAGGENVYRHAAEAAIGLAIRGKRVRQPCPALGLA